ncbi:thiol-disulfide oxidoreductase DCC family protein [Riemerella columbina]|uniref:thiol-disulfide oxidoreductase DCC family protein n=1 Tax=Riemerella columbina TaxID=103810 RepID=UPI00266F205A|nr:DUF393 domain-containing protein [Riemerella columbina]WKS95491.1 DUF393 domain-containing protein [Riemerella columbina]
MRRENLYYLFYDGDCGLCNRWVQWVLKYDKKDQFRFAALQSDFGQKFLRERQLPTKDFNTLYLWKPNDFYLEKSDAVLEIARQLGGQFWLLYAGKVVPRVVRHWVYDAVAKARFRLAKPTCLLPTAAERHKFL